MGKNQSKQPLTQEELYKIYNQYKSSNNAKVLKSKKLLPLDLANDEPLYCLSVACVRTKNRQKKWRKFFKRSCFKLIKKYQWGSILLSELKKFPSKTDSKYLIDLTWLKISLFDDDNIIKSLRRVAPDYEKASPKHNRANNPTLQNFSEPCLIINRETISGDEKEMLKNNSNISEKKMEILNFEISQELKSPNGFSDICEKNKENQTKEIHEEPKKMFSEKINYENMLAPKIPLKESISFHDTQRETQELQKKNFSSILHKSQILEENPFLNKVEKDLARLSFCFAQKNENDEENNPTEEEIPAIKFYRHNTFINSVKIFERKYQDSFIDVEEKELNGLIRAITHYKVLTEQIEKHLNNPEMVLCSLKEKYIDYYVNKYDAIIKEKEQYVGQEQLYQISIDEAFNDLLEFINIFHQTIYYFYKIQYLDQKIFIEKSFFKPDNLHNFITSIMLDRKIYSILYLSLIQSLEDKEDSLRMALQYCQSFEPKDFNVPDKYCLDDNTIDFYLKNKKMSDTSIVLKGLSKDLDSPSNKKKNAPYESAIKCLEEIQFVRSPLHKLKALVRTGDEIFQNIEDFYKEHGFEFNKDFLSADDVLPIFTYVVAKSQVKCFYSQVKIMEELASKNLKKTLSGYYLVTLQIALNFIENCFKKKQEQESAGIADFHRDEFSAKASFSENMGFHLNEIKETNAKKSLFNKIKEPFSNK